MKKRRFSRPDQACKGCEYHGKLHPGETSPGCCDYLLITGRRRPCPPGAGCTEKRLVNRRKRRKAGK